MGVPKVVMYVADWCPYCARARSLLEGRGVAIEEIDVDAMPGAREEMRARSGRDTVPQIFIGESHVGGSDELQALDADGRLDALLKQPEP
ncbi:MAG TPA: glutaredoxin 3 [Steroidobacteraceae bacterium]|jgi:glutaredoxin 3|nr:glutaredoxin 3 [Steroidobacteraceae bacterium]